MSKTKQELKEASQKRTLQDLKNQVNWWRLYPFKDLSKVIIKINPLEEVNKCNKK